MIPVVMSGGCGTRLWPLSRQQKPKQFLSLLNQNTMFENTLLRLKGIPDLKAPIVVCNEDHRFMVAEQLNNLSLIENSIIALEPEGRNTAPAIAAAAFAALELEDDPLLLVLAADHEIVDIKAFHAAIENASKAALSGSLVTFGIVPTSAHTGYGYIRADKQKQQENCYPVSAFVEKPDLKTAEQYLESGAYYWNSGMFLFKASVLLRELEKFAPEIISACKSAVDNAQKDLDFLRLDKAAFIKSPSDSIDYALMEKTDKAVVLPLDAGWSDVGAWPSLWALSEKDEQQNVLKGDAIIESVSNSYIHSENKLVTVLGLDDVVVVETADVVMVAHKDRAEDIKSVADKLKKQGRDEVISHRKVYRPWGYYDAIDSGNRFQVKRIVVKPGEKLSVQMHHHRAEHWVVVSGTANVTRGEETFIVSENQSTYIAIGEIHALENPGTIPLEMIEVQSGSYLGEDDIIRFDDRYGRSE